MEFIGFFSTYGRVNTGRFAIVLGIAFAVLRITIVQFWEGDTLAYVLTGGLWGAVLAKVVAEAGRRLHDTGASGWVGLWLPVTLTVYGWLLAEGGAPGWVRWLSGAAAFVSAARFAVRGELVPNAWGERPDWLALGRYPNAVPVASTLGWAATSIAGGALIGWALISISHGMARSHAETQKWLAAHPHEATVDPLSQRPPDHP